jgi:hypothetical protein
MAMADPAMATEILFGSMRFFGRYLVQRVRYDRDLRGGGPTAGLCTCGRDAKKLMALLADHFSIV